MKFALSLICALLAVVSATKVDYSGHMVIRTVAKTNEQVEFLRDWRATSAIDFWKLPAKINDFADIHVTPESYYAIARTLANMKMDHTIQIFDLGKLQQEESQSMILRRALHSGKAIDVANYHTYEEIMAYLADLASTNSLVTTKVGGMTAGGREIVQITISSDLAANRPVNFFDCNIHAREWITGATCLWIIDQMTTNYGTDAEITALVDKYDWKFVPISNPDGYDYTWTTDRLWRKNRVVNSGSACLGVDVNRNFPIGFGGSGASNLGCSDTYHGVAAFSELEAIALRDLMAADRGRINIAISVHSYSQLWLSPYGYVSSLPTDYPAMLSAMQIGVNAITATYGTPYTYGSTGATLYIASGVTTDYYYETEGIVHSYTIELRDTGRYGFQLPADQIVPTAEETWNGLKAMINSL